MAPKRPRRARDGQAPEEVEAHEELRLEGGSDGGGASAAEEERSLDGGLEEAEEGLGQDEEEASMAKETGKKKTKGKKRGVVYLSHPPAFMKPVKVRHLLGMFGEVTNLYLEPEDSTIRKTRKKRGGSSKIKYKEGWIEFADRKVAKAVAQSLNGKPVGGNRRSFHYEDLWTLKYLPGFEWAHLTEKAAYERRTRKIRLRAELASAKRENEHYLESVAKSKQIKAIASNKEQRAHRKQGATASEAAAASGGELGRSAPVKRTFKQLDPLEEYKNKRVHKSAPKEEDWLGSVFT